MVNKINVFFKKGQSMKNVIFIFSSCTKLIDSTFVDIFWIIHDDSLVFNVERQQKINFYRERK